jgi:N-acetylglucosaminyldiphosphoundecaprenol N-acetyl-beta-D-mannosaminyltransferase
MYVGDVTSAARWVLEQTAEDNSGGYVCLCNVHFVIEARRNHKLGLSLENAAMVFPDGAPLAWLLRRVGYRSARRIAGPDLMIQVMDDGRDSNVRHFLFGSSESVLLSLHKRLLDLYPGIQFAGCLSPPFFRLGEDDGMGEFVEEINDAQPDIVWLSLGCPKEGLWMARYAQDLAPAVVVGVGAAFDFHSGVKTRAPAWMQRVGLEWLYRLAAEPQRLAVRYLSTNGSFVVLAALELMKRKLHSPGEVD